MDETGPINLLVWASKFEKFKKGILQSKLLMVYGHLQMEKRVIPVTAQRCHNLNFPQSKLTAVEGQDIPVAPLSRADEKTGAPVPSPM